MNDRASSLVERVIAHLKRRHDAIGVGGASDIALDKLESKLMVELPPSLRTFLQFDFTFASLGARFHGKVVRLPNLPGRPWNALYLGEARRDGELVILGFENEDTLVKVYPRYTALDLYLCDQIGLRRRADAQRLDDLESHVARNPELAGAEEEEEAEGDY